MSNDVELPIALGVALNTGRPELLEHYTGDPAISAEATRQLVQELLTARETIRQQDDHIGELTRKLERARRFLRKLHNAM